MHGSSPSPFVKNIVSICSAARTSPHNYAFIEGPFAALETSTDYANGELEVMESIWGHFGGGGANLEDAKWMDGKIEKFLAK